MSDWYRELQADAHDALEKLLTHTKPGTGLYLHSALAQLRKDIERQDSPPPVTPQTRQERRETSTADALAAYRADRQAVKRAWKETDLERLILDAVGDERLPLRDIADRAKRLCPDLPYLHSERLRPTAMKMIAAGELEREEETWGSRTRWTFFRRTRLDGPIVDLERAFHDEVA